MDVSIDAGPTSPSAAKRDVYVPSNEPDMAHRSALSPDGKWVVVEMDIDHRGSHAVWFPRIAVRLCGPSGPVVLLCERQLTKLREELVEAIKWDGLRRRDLDAQRSA